MTGRMTPTQSLVKVFNAALAAVDPYQAVCAAVRVEHGRLLLPGAGYDLAVFEQIVVVGGGKATARMAQAIEALLGDKISAGLIIVKDGHAAPLAGIEQVESSHPVPGEAGVEATRRILEMVRAADGKTLVICLISGGASALLVSPVPGITLQDKQQITRQLLNAGASIAELNAVRKHLSLVKGGKLAQAAYPATVLAMILSDVIGDPLDVIASGPTAPDSSSFADAWAVVKKYCLVLPPHVSDYLQRGLRGLVAETAKPDEVCFTKTHNVIVASLQQAIDAASDTAARMGYAVQVLTTTLQGEAHDAAQFLAQAARAQLADMQPGERRCLLCGGETTVVVHGSGLGGRNQELALAFALAVDGLQGVTLLSAGTDGTDGPTDAAGAIVGGATIPVARKLGLDPMEFLANNDSYNFFRRLDELTGAGGDFQSCHFQGCHFQSYHFRTGATGTNVMDIQVVLLDKDHYCPE